MGEYELTDIARPVEVFLEQVDAFNSRDLERFVGTYSPEARVSRNGGNVVRGRDSLREHYAVRLANPSIFCDVRAVAEFGGRWVVAHEFVSDGQNTTEVVATFEIVNGAIVAASRTTKDDSHRPSSVDGKCLSGHEASVLRS